MRRPLLPDDALYDADPESTEAAGPASGGILKWLLAPTTNRIFLLTVFALCVWLGVLSFLLVSRLDAGQTVANNSTSSINATAISPIIASFTPSPAFCSRLPPSSSLPQQLGVSLDSAAGGVVAGAGSSVYSGVQQHAYSGFTPNHLSLLGLRNNTALLCIGSALAVGWGGDDWISGASLNFGNASAAGRQNAAWSAFTPLPFTADNVVLLQPPSAVQGKTALVVAVSGQGAVACAVDADSGEMSCGPPARFVTVGPSVDTDTAALDSRTFAVSFYQDAGSSISLNTVVGTVASLSSLNISFSPAVTYSPNHEVHQIAALDSAMYLLAFPMDDPDSDAAASPMAVMVSTVGKDGAVTVWSADGKGAPWLQPAVLGHYFFDILLLQADHSADGLTAAVAMAVIDRSAGDALVLMLVNVVAKGSAADGWSEVRVTFGQLLTATTAGATLGYEYFAMLPLFDSAAAANSSRSHLSDSRDPARDFIVAWQDTAMGGAVEAVVVSYAARSRSLSIVMPATAITPPLPSSSPSSLSFASHWWIAGGSLPGGDALLLVTWEQSGNLTLIEHQPAALGIVSAPFPCDGGAVTAATVDVAVGGVIAAEALGAAGSQSMARGVWSTSRGVLLQGREAEVSPAAGGKVTVMVGQDACLGLQVLGADGGGAVWLSGDVCTRHAAG